jgi:hypothetical protein
VVRGISQLEITSIRTAAAAPLARGSNEDGVTRSAGEISQHGFLATVAELTGGETIPIIGERGSSLPVPAMFCKQEVSAAAGNASIAIASAAATSLERGVITK